MNTMRTATIVTATLTPIADGWEFQVHGAVLGRDAVSSLRRTGRVPTATGAVNRGRWFGPAAVVQGRTSTFTRRLRLTSLGYDRSDRTLQA